MKKLLAVESRGLFSNKFTRTALVLVFGLALIVAFWTITTAVARADGAIVPSEPSKDKEKDKDKDKDKDCTVCHNGKDKKIDCDKVNEWLRTHPGDTRGPCQPTPVKNR